jgi:hypothetical protein
MKEKLWPHLIKVWSEFFHEANEKGYEATLAKLLRSLAKTYREAIEEYSTRLKNAESNDERAEILGELCASGYLKLTSASGKIRMVAAGGKGIARVVGKGPGQKDILQGKLAKELENLSEKLGPEKTAELVGKVEELAKAGGAAAKAENDIAKALAKDGQSRSPVAASGKGGPGGSAELVADLEKQGIVRGVKGGMQDSAGRLGVREGSQLKHFADLTKHSGKSAEELANGLRGAQGKIGEALEEHLAQAFGGRSSFKVGGRDFDGAVNNLWYEAKSGRYWVDNYGNKGFAKFKSDMGARLRIASENGKEYQLISNTPISSEAKAWLTEKGIKFLEILE